MTGLGVGVLALPWTVAGAGIVNGILWNTFQLGMFYWTSMRLIYAAEKEQVFTMEGLLERANLGKLGAVWRYVCFGAIWCSSCVCLTSYIIVISDAARPCFKGFFGRDPGIVSGERCSDALM